MIFLSMETIDCSPTPRMQDKQKACACPLSISVGLSFLGALLGGISENTNWYFQFGVLRARTRRLALVGGSSKRFHANKAFKGKERKGK